MHLVDDKMDLSLLFSAILLWWISRFALVIKPPRALCPLYHDALSVAVPCLFTSSVNWLSLWNSMEIPQGVALFFSVKTIPLNSMNRPVTLERGRLSLFVPFIQSAQNVHQMMVGCLFWSGSVFHSLPHSFRHSDEVNNSIHANAGVNSTFLHIWTSPSQIEIPVN